MIPPPTVLAVSSVFCVWKRLYLRSGCSLMEAIALAVILVVVVLVLAVLGRAHDEALTKDFEEDTHGEYGCLASVVMVVVVCAMALAFISVGSAHNGDPNSYVPIPAAAAGWDALFGDDGNVCLVGDCQR